jgi:hypothetical protein
LRSIVAGDLPYTPLNAANNLSDLASASTARTNLGLTSPATATPASLTETTSSVLTITGGSVALLAATTITVAKATTSASGYLSSSDWNTFSSKQSTVSIVNDTNLTGSISSGAITLAWAGTLAAARLNANVVQSVSNDTNITGSIASQVLTLGFTGTLAKARQYATTVYTDQVNTFGAYTQTFNGAATLATASTATSGTNYAAPAFSFANSYYNGSAAVADTWALTPTIATGTTPASTLTLSHSGATSSNALKILGGTAGGVSAIIDSGASGASATLAFWDNNGTVKWQVQKQSSQNLVFIDSGSNQTALSLGSNGPLYLQPQGRNVLVGTTTDSGSKLQVNGSTATIDPRPPLPMSAPLAARVTLTWSSLCNPMVVIRSPRLSALHQPATPR